MLREDSFRLRRAKVNKIELELVIINTLPILVSKKDYLLADKTIRTVKDARAGLAITDEAYKTENKKDRYILTGQSKSALTYNHIYFYYDRKYKDIIIVPDLTYLTLGNLQMSFTLNCYRLGSNTSLTDADINSLLGMGEETRVHLPETKSGITFHNHLLALPGTGTGNAQTANRIEEQINN